MLKLVLRAAVFALLLAMVSTGFGYYQLQRYLDSPLLVPAEGMEYALLKGGSLNSMAYGLAAEGVLDSPRWLTAYSRLTGRGAVIKAGDYWLEQGMTPRQLLLKLERGEVRYFQVTLVEGWNLVQVLAALEAQPRLKHLLDKGVANLSPAQLGIDTGTASSLEGMFFPDTYRYHSGSSDVELLQQSYRRMQTILEREWLQREPGLPYKTPYESVILSVSCFSTRCFFLRCRGIIFTTLIYLILPDGLLMLLQRL